MDVFVDFWGTLLLMAGLLVGSAFFSGAETALFSLSRQKVNALRKQRPDAKRLLDLLAEDPSGLLVALLFGNLVINILYFSSSVSLAQALGEIYGQGAEVLFGLWVLVAVVLGGEILPKAAGISFAERVVRVSAFPLWVWYRAIGPVRRLLKRGADFLEPEPLESAAMTAAELKVLIDATQHDSSFGHQEKAIVEEIASLPEMRLREVMVHRVDQLLVQADQPAQWVLDEAVKDGVRWVPVYEQDEDDIIGIVSVRHLFAVHGPDEAVRQGVEPVLFVPETKRVDVMLRQFMEEELELVCVVDEYGGLAGTVRLEDLLEEVVGDFDAMEQPSVEQLGEGIYRLGGQLSIREWRRLFVGFLPDDVMRLLALDTVSGLVVSLLKRMPVAGDEAVMRNLKFTVEAVRGNRIESVVLELLDREAIGC